MLNGERSETGSLAKGRALQWIEGSHDGMIQDDGSEQFVGGGNHRLRPGASEIEICGDPSQGIFPVVQFRGSLSIRDLEDAVAWHGVHGEMKAFGKPLRGDDPEALDIADQN